MNVNIGDTLAFPAKKLAAALMLLVKFPVVEPLPSVSVTDLANAPT